MNGRLKPKMLFRQRVIASVRDYFGLQESPTWITIPRADETEHIMLLGDPGTGKSQTIHHFLLQIAVRQSAEAVMIYDPACEFIKRHYNQQRGDVILNPTDLRSPYWSPSVEVHTLTDKKLLAESFLPGKSDAQQASTPSFFLKAARAIFGRMLELKPTPAQMVQWLKSDDAIDVIVAGTEHTHLIPKNAHGQRAGVLGVLSELGDILRLLPERDACESEISLSEWARHRRGWIFITSRMDMREALRPLQAAFINILMKRLMSVSPEWGQAHPCWLIVDEVHSLHRLPALYETETEGRKYGIKLIQGTQGKTQYEEYYERLSKAMLAAPKLKLFFRCGESESARWISDTIGEYEVEKPRIATTASVEDRGRDALNYSTTTEHHQAISKEEIMCLPDLHGFWKYGDVVVAFRLPLASVKIVAPGYIPRELPRVEVNLSALQPGSSDGRHKSPTEQSDKQSNRSPLTSQDTKQHEHRIVEIETENVIGSVVTGPETAYEEAAQKELVIVEEKTGTASEMTSEEMEVEAQLD
jgi:hypothetical protein